MVRAHGPAHAFVAHSMGAAATALALGDGVRADRVVLLAPMASPAAYGRHFATALGFGERTYPRLMARIERRIGSPLQLFAVPQLARAVAAPPALIVHDRDDQILPISDGVEIAAAWPGSVLRQTSGLGHRRLLRDPAVVAAVVDFVTR